MKNQHYYYLGYVQRLHSSDGRLKIKLDVDDPSAYRHLDALFIKIGLNHVPFLVEKLHLQDKGLAIVTLQDVDEQEQAEVLVGKEIYLPLEALPELGNHQFYYHEVKGFMVVDKYLGPIGEVVDILEYPGQDLIQVYYNNMEVLIPINDDTIHKLDRKSQQLHVEMPDGLLDVYLNNEEE